MELVSSNGECCKGQSCNEAKAVEEAVQSQRPIIKLESKAPPTLEELMINVLELSMLVNRLQSEQASMAQGIQGSMSEMFKVLSTQMTELETKCKVN